MSVPFVFLLSTFIWCHVHPVNGKTFILGYLATTYRPFLSVEELSPAIIMAIEDFKSTGALAEHDFKIIWADDKCRPKFGTHTVMRFYRDEGMDVLLGCGCSEVTFPVSYYLTYWDFPIITHASANSLLSDKKIFNTLIRPNSGYNKQGDAMVELFKALGWKKAALINSQILPCHYGGTAIYEQFPKHDLEVTEWLRADDNASDEKLDDYIDRIIQRSRIVLTCFVMEAEIRFMMRVLERGLTSPDFVFIYFINFPFPALRTPWMFNLPPDASEELIATRKAAFYNFKVVTMASLDTPRAREFMESMPDRINEPPWTESPEPLLQGVKGSVFSLFMYDATYLYLTLLNETLQTGANYRSGTLLFNMTLNRTFTNMMTGNMAMDGKADRQPDYWMYYYKPGEDFMHEDIEISLIKPPGQRVYSMYNMTYWGTPDNKPPPDTPPCGFNNEFCPEDKTVQNAIILGVSIGAFLLAVAATAFFINYRRKMLEEQLNQMAWRVNYSDLERAKKTNATGSAMSMNKSIGSLASGKSGINQLFTELFYLKGNLVAVKNMPANEINLDRQDLIELKELRELSHVNVNAFLGACIDPPKVCVISQYCSKGSLQDILANEDIGLEWMFKTSLITDMATGMAFLHSTSLQSHGNLKSTNCLVDSRWVLKISSFGLHAFRKHLKVRDADEAEMSGKLLWTAPELLRESARPRNGTQKGDVYSFAIIVQEIIFREDPFFLRDDLTAKDVINKVRQGNNPPYRPVIPEPPEDTQPVIVDLMKDCWAEDPGRRPSFNDALRVIKSLNKGKKSNLMDIMVQRLEKYANNLEDIVAQRTAELMIEKKKTDTLLYRMLPPTIAEELKQGRQVRPEEFDAVTIFFSDIVGFTSLSSESTPIQVIDLLNDLYTLFDDIIEQHDVYKVETIGDAYMVVSGLPKRNGERHAGEVANMALDLLSAVTTFRIRHRPEKSMELRAGLHTGPCASGPIAQFVSGGEAVPVEWTMLSDTPYDAQCAEALQFNRVVGLTMPRYCLFGDTVNMASRMESNGLALRIHLSQDCQASLEVLGGYWTVLRGEMEIKGKGQQKTFWLSGKDGYDKPLPKV